MHEPPSDQLVRQLTELELCRPRDLFRARGRVRRLSFDLPAFDSVWIDSLVQLRLLTPYQARQLELGRGDGLRIGSLVAIDELGRSARGSTYLARRLHRRDRCVVKRQIVSHERLSDTQDRMASMLEQLSGFVHPQLVVPHEVIRSDEELVTVSRYVPGLPLNELLVRRGRFPATVVLEIGRQLLEGLAALHAKSLIHGDIRLSNIRLTDSGLAVLVNGAIRPVTHPQYTIHDGLSLDSYDGLAPELIGTGAPATASSELYALGCVLWQLLTGRPPYVSADPLAKIAAHQTRNIEDVRVWAPDTPALLADSIRQLTSSLPNARPRSFQEVLQAWGVSGSFGRSRLRQFRRLFNTAVPHFSKASKSKGASNWVWTALTFVGVASGAAFLYDRGMRNELLSVSQNVKAIFDSLPEQPADSTEISAIAPNRTTSTDHVDELLPLPAPNANGVILLTERGPYEASEIMFDGPRLTIRGNNGIAAEIHVTEEPFNLVAQEVSLERVTVRNLIQKEVTAAVMIRSNSLKLVNCEFLGSDQKPDSSEQPDSEGESSTDDESPIASPAIAWTRFGGPESNGGEITVRNTVFHGDGVAAMLANTPRLMKIENSLKTGSAAFVLLDNNKTGTAFALSLDRVTLRKSGPLLHIRGEMANRTGTPPLQVKAQNCVFNLDVNRTALIIVDSAIPQRDLAKSIAVKATESVVEPGTMLFASFDSSQDKLLEIDDDEQFEGLVASEIKFAGAHLHRSGDAKTASVQGARTLDAAHPGIDPTLLGPNRQSQ